MIAFVNYNKLRWNIHKCFILMFCFLQWHGEMPPSLTKKCIWLSTLTCCAPLPWHKPLSCFPGSLLARCQNPLSFGSDALFGTCSTMAPIQRAQTFGKTCAANTSEKWGWEIIILFLPFSPIFINIISQHWQVTVHVLCPLWPYLKLKAMLNFKLW